MSFWGKVFGTDKAIQMTVESVRDGLDALVYTDEEKAGDAAKERSEARSMVVDWMAATQGQNLARRIIALSITGVWLLDIIIAQVIGAFALLAPDRIGVDGEILPSKLQELAEFMTNSAMEMNSAVMLILAFYFAANYMEDIAKAVSTNFTKKINKS